MDTINFVLTDSDGDETVVSKSFYGSLEEMLDFFLLCLRAVMGYNLPGEIQYIEPEENNNSNDNLIMPDDDLVE